MENYEVLINEILEYYFATITDTTRTFRDRTKERFNIGNEDTEFFWNKYMEIHGYASTWACKWADGKIAQSVVRNEVRKKYPFLKQVIRDRIVESAMHASQM